MIKGYARISIQLHNSTSLYLYRNSHIHPLYARQVYNVLQSTIPNFPPKVAKPWLSAPMNCEVT